MKILTILAMLASSTSSFAQDEIFKPKHGGEVIKKSGLGYEVVRKKREILVYPPKEKDFPTPSTVIVKFKNKKGIVDQMELKLLPMKEPGTNVYSAPVPASVYIAGGVTFDLNLNKK
jgi:hypothetical protein